MSIQENIKILKSIAKKIVNKLHCDRHGSCVHFAEIFVDEVNEQYPELLNDFDVIEGYVNVKFGDGIPQEHTWIKLNNGEIIDPTFLQFNKYDKEANYSKKRTKVYSGQEYYDEGKEGSWFAERRKKLPSSVFKEEKRESIRRILREEGFIPLPIKRRVSPEDIEEAFDYALERMGGSMNNPDSIIYKEKGTTLKIFAKFVIDEMVTYIEQDYFNDNNRIYFSDNDEDYEIYHEKIRKPLLRHYGKRIKEKYDEVMSSNDQEIIKEVRVPRSERVELYRDDNIIVVVPLTHRALQKYAHRCLWCINDDIGEWEDYHKGKHAVIIQRNPKKPKIGITGNPTPSEIFLLSKWDNNQSDFDDVCQMLDYEFRNDRTMSDYYVTISNDINNFATNIVYYSPENGIYDQEDNFLWNFDYEITDIPNVTPEVIKIMDDYLQENKEMTLQESIRRILREDTSRKTKLLNTIDKIGFLRTSDIVGGVERLLDIVGSDYLTDSNKIDIIKEIIESNNGEYITLSELGEEPILVDDDGVEFSQIEILYSTDVMLYHYDKETGNDHGESFMDYVQLRSYVLDDIFNMLLDYYINNN